MDADGFLGPDDALPARPCRVLVDGASGAGKSRLAAEVARRLGLAYTEIDSLYHGPGWVPRPEFVADVTALAAGEAWAAEHQYSAVRHLLAARSDLVVWLDLSRWRVLSQVVGRTVRRRFSRRPIWNGNREPPFRTILTNPDHIVRWSWGSHPRVAPRIAALHARRPDLPVVRLRRRREVRRWLRGPLARAAEEPQPRARVAPVPEHLNNHHRDTVDKIVNHPVSHNVEWHSVVSLLNDIGETEQQHDGKLKVTVAGQTETLTRPHGDDVDEQTIVDLRRMLMAAGYGPVDNHKRED